jgi:hypothetical protein
MKPSRTITTLGGYVHVFEFGSLVFVSEEKFNVGDILSMRVDPVTNVVTYAVGALVIFVSDDLYSTEEHDYVDAETSKLVQKQIREEKLREDLDFFDSAGKETFFD